MHPCPKSDSATEAGLAICNRLLRGELSAQRAFRRVLPEFDGDSAGAWLLRREAEHAQAVGCLRSIVLELGGKPATDVGGWDVFFRSGAVVADRVSGRAAALRGILQGEECELDDYEDALEDEALLPACKTLIRTVLAPRALRHLDWLEEVVEHRLTTGSAPSGPAPTDGRGAFPAG